MGITFLENHDNNPNIIHKDGDNTNNCLNNLEWVANSRARKSTRDKVKEKVSKK